MVFVIACFADDTWISRSFYLPFPGKFSGAPPFVSSIWETAGRNGFVVLPEKQQGIFSVLFKMVCKFYNDIFLPGGATSCYYYSGWIDLNEMKLHRVWQLPVSSSVHPVMFSWNFPNPDLKKINQKRVDLLNKRVERRKILLASTFTRKMISSNEKQFKNREFKPNNSMKSRIVHGSF